LSIFEVAGADTEVVEAVAATGGSVAEGAIEIVASMKN
jgi:hypothetical protein